MFFCYNLGMKFRQSLFWDTDPSRIDPKKHARYIIERILEFGTDAELRWMAQKYSKAEIKNAIDRPRSQVREKTKSLWRLLLK